MTNAASTLGQCLGSGSIDVDLEFSVDQSVEVTCGQAERFEIVLAPQRPRRDLIAPLPKVLKELGHLQSQRPHLLGRGEPGEFARVPLEVGLGLPDPL